MPPDQQGNSLYSQYGVFWLYNWFQADDNNNMSIFFLMNGNIYGYSLSSASSEPYEWDCGWSGCYSAYPISPNPPANTINGEPILVQSYINAYNTAFNQPLNYQAPLYKYTEFTYSDVNNDFVPGTFGYEETYNSNEGPFYIRKLIDNSNDYAGTPYLFVSAGSGRGSGFMYLNWIIVTYGVPYVISVS